MMGKKKYNTFFYSSIKKLYNICRIHKNSSRDFAINRYNEHIEKAHKKKKKKKPLKIDCYQNKKDVESQYGKR